MSKNCSIPLFSGIGNIIQSLPFVFEMKKRYEKVTAFNKSMDFPETKKLVGKAFDCIYPNLRSVPKDYKIFRAPIRRPFSEYKAWFIDNKERLPDKFNIDFINYTKMEPKYKIVVCPECKDNWICKKWLYWPDLISELEDVAIVGLRKKDKFENVTDYRGKLSLLETGGLIRNSTIFIGNEGGISHYSAALGTKTYIIFGCTDTIKNMPPNNAISISKDLSCQPCQFTDIVQKGIIFLGCKERKCLKELTVENVMEVITNDSTNIDSM